MANLSTSPTTHLPKTPKKQATSNSGLTPSDMQKLASSYITPELAEAAGITRVDSPTGAEYVARKPSAKNNYAGLIIPYFWPGDSRPREYRLRRDNPDLEQTPEGLKEKGKYLSPPGKSNLLYFPPSVQVEMLQDCEVGAIFTEGEKKSLALSRYAQERNTAALIIGLSGGWNWRGTVGKAVNDNGQRQAVKGVISDFDRIEWEGRKALIIFDANVATNESVKAARDGLARELKRRGATVVIVDLPANLAEVNGVDDLLARYGADFLTSLIERAEAETLKKPKHHKTQVGNYTFTVSESGLWATDDEGNKTRITSPLYIEADTRNPDNEDWGRLLRFPDREGIEHEYAMPMSLLGGDGTEYRRMLFSMGLDPVAGKKPRELLALYLNSRPEKTVLCVDKIGWHEGKFVLSDETIRADEGERIYLQSRIGANRKLKTSGTLEDWRDNVSILCVNNSRLVFAVSVSFAATLLDIIGMESGGFHLRGTTTKGKSTVQVVAGSVWGTGGLKGSYAETWEATSTGLEVTAQLHNDGLLLLDEIGQCAPEVVNNAAYKLAQGQSKNRSHAEIAQRKALHWRVLFISSGEKTIDEHLREIGKRSQGGQEVRIVNIEAQSQSEHGAFEDLQGFKSAKEFADFLNETSRKYYGTAIREYLRKIVSSLPLIRQQANTAIKSFIANNVPSKASGEVERVAARFALVAFAGEVATTKGITGWEQGEATKAAVKLFSEWLKARGTIGNSDEETAVRQVKAFLEMHGASRFQSTDTPDARIINRAGFKNCADDGTTEFLILPEVFRNEVCKGIDYEMAAQALKKRGCLVLPKDGRMTVQRRLPDFGKPRVYIISETIFEQGSSG